MKKLEQIRQESKEIKDKIDDTEERLRQLKNQEQKILKQDIVKRRKERTHRLITRGAILESLIEKAKELRRLADKMVTLGKRNDLHAKRQVNSFLFDNEAAKKVFTEYNAKYESRNGGYTRIIKTGVRRGDAAEMCIIEMVLILKTVLNRLFVYIKSLALH
ncbi:MAG: 50S ribosomal protein L17 [Ezakiella sp.]|nr:50S ribosomal protein L17 [Ezakiella sp.]MDD7471511.1 50S ribosomal protein L17 [Bacillota bacterium]